MLDSLPLWRQATRTWLRAPRSAVAAGVTLAIAVGALTAVTAVVEPVLLRPLPIEDEDRVVRIVSTRADRGGHYAPAYHNAWEWRQRQSSFSALAITVAEPVVGPDPDLDRWTATRTDAELLAVLGVAPRLGRWIEPREVELAAPVVVLSDHLWRSRFGADPGIVGSDLLVDGVARTVLGVLPDGGSHTRSARWLALRDLYLPLDVPRDAFEKPAYHGYGVLARLRDDVDLERARADLTSVAAALETAYPAFNDGWTVELHPVRWWIDEGMRAPLLLLLAGGLVVLLVAGANVVNLLLAHQLARAGELRVRRALGAGRRSLFAQTLRETAILTAAAAAAGLVLSAPAVVWLREGLLETLPRGELVALDLRVGVLVVAATMTVTFLCALLATVLALRAGNAGALLDRFGPARGVRRWASAAIALETALAVAAVVVSLLLARSVSAIAGVDPGFDPDGLLTARVELPAGDAEPESSRRSRLQSLLDRLAALPEVETAALSGVQLPLADGQGTFELFVEGQPRSETPEVVVNAQSVSPGYFETMGIRLVEGSLFGEDASWDSANEVVVNRAFAQRYFPTGAVGRWVEWASGDRGTVIGVVEDVRQLGLHRAPAPEVYLAWAMVPASQALVVRSDRRPIEGLWPLLRAEIEVEMPDARIREVVAGREMVSGSYAFRRFLAGLAGGGAGLAVLLGALGVFSLVQHGVRGRRREAAVRAACGARPREIVALFTRAGVLPAAIGAGLGLPLAVAAARGVSSQLFGVGELDPVSHLGAVALLLAAAWAAATLPARESARIDPGSELRGE